MMFAGHFAVGLALKTRYRNVPAWALLLAALLCDWLWLLLSALEVEHFRLFFGLNGALQLDRFEVPYSHSLFWSAFYALIVFLLFVRAEGQRHWAAPLSLAVFSHWILDWLVADPALPFANFGPAIKFGLGIFPAAGLMVEAVIVLACWGFYDRRTRNFAAARNWRQWAVLAALLVALCAPPLLQRLF
jgi:hypothetical protein